MSLSLKRSLLNEIKLPITPGRLKLNEKNDKVAVVNPFRAIAKCILLPHSPRCW